MFTSIIELFENKDRGQLKTLFSELTPEQTYKLFQSDEIKEYFINKYAGTDTINKMVFKVLYDQVIKGTFLKSGLNTNEEILKGIIKTIDNIKETINIFKEDKIEN